MRSMAALNNRINIIPHNETHSYINIPTYRYHSLQFE